MKACVIICVCALTLIGCKAENRTAKSGEPANKNGISQRSVKKTEGPSQQAEKEKAALDLARKIALRKKETWISKEKAISIASEEFLKTHESLNELNIIVCETAWFWLIIYDGSGLEYVVDKSSGIFYGVQKTLHEAEESNQANQQLVEEGNDVVNTDRAAFIARRDFRESLKKLDIAENKEEQYNIFTCELSKVWRVYVEYRELPGKGLPNAHAPDYVIDKRSGKIIYKQFVY